MVSYAVNTMHKKHWIWDLVNTVVPLERVEAETIQWCEEILEKSPTALRFLKAAFNADSDGLAGIQQLAGDATLLYYQQRKQKKDAIHLRKNVNQTSINFLVFLKNKENKITNSLMA